MSLIVSDSGGNDFEPIPEGVHIAVCDLVADLGIQPGGKFKPRHAVYIRWQIPEVRRTWVGKDMNEQEGPARIGQTYTASLSSKANLRKVLEAWRGRSFTPAELDGFDLFNVLGANCQMQIGHTRGDDGKTYTNIMAIMALPKNAPREKAEGDLIKYSRQDQGQFNLLPEWLRFKIDSQEQDTASPPTSAYDSTPDFDDDIPFAWAIGLLPLSYMAVQVTDLLIGGGSFAV